MPKLIDYPRTSYAGAWELSEVVDDTGGKCAIDTAARKLSRKVSGSFKAIIGSAVKFGLLVSKRDLLTTTTLFRRIKHAYDKSEELVFHREAFLTPPLFTQVCRKFRARELPVQMLDVMLIREFGVEEINALGVAKAFTDGARAVGLLDEQNILADIDQLTARQLPRRELASPPPPPNAFRPAAPGFDDTPSIFDHDDEAPGTAPALTAAASATATAAPADAVEALFAFPRTAVAAPSGSKPEPAAVAAQTPALPAENAPPARNNARPAPTSPTHAPEPPPSNATPRPAAATVSAAHPAQAAKLPPTAPAGVVGTAEATGRSLTYQVQLSGPGVNTTLTITEEADLDLAQALLDKIRRQLRQQ